MRVIFGVITSKNIATKEICFLGVTAPERSTGVVTLFFRWLM